MSQVEIRLPHHTYKVTIEPGALGRMGERIQALAPNSRCALFADVRVAALHGDVARTSLEAAGYAVTLSEVEPGESNKTLATVQSMYEVLLGERFERRSPLVALGGGVLGDMVGFTAATYLRGVPFVQCPTTLLAMVDSSVGGKTGVNVPQGKNLIGAFHQPVAVVIDPNVLTTLPARELQCGLAECIKHGVIRDAALFDFIRDRADEILGLDPAALSELVERNVSIKATVVMEDEREQGVRAHLNFGHTFAHAIEATAGYGEILHGEAVGLGMLAATRTAVDMGLCAASVVDALRALLERVGLPTSAAIAADDVLGEAMKLDKKVASNRVRFVLPERLGAVVVRDDVPQESVLAGWREIRRSG